MEVTDDLCDSWGTILTLMINVFKCISYNDCSVTGINKYIKKKQKKSLQGFMCSNYCWPSKYKSILD